MKRYARYFYSALVAGLMALPFTGNGQEPEPLELVPTPASIEHKDGNFLLAEETRIFLPKNIERPEWLAVRELEEVIRENTGIDVTLDRLGLDPVDTDQPVILQVQDPPIVAPGKKDGYTLKIAEGDIHITGRSASGLLYGIKTLQQLVQQFGSEIPAMIIQDEPAFLYRGVYHDVSRGKVPRVETIKWLVDYLADRKVNMFQLYIEHPFMFRFDPDIAQNQDGLTPEEILEIQEFCQDRRVDFVPSLQSFGHMAGVFSLPKYRELAEVELETSWEDLTWHERMVGATLNPKDPEAIEVLENMYDDYLPLFDSSFVNVCADETYDLGKTKNKELAEEIGKERLYLQHIDYLNDLTQKYDKRMMFWGDIVKKDESVVPDIPKDAILLNWGYSRDFNFDSTKLFTDHDLDVFVCPGTSGWNQILNMLDNAGLNIRRHAKAGQRHGAIGFLNTDWGDHGHYNLLSGSLQPFALGAAVAWNPNAPERKEFDRIWNKHVFGDPEAKGIQALREVTAISLDHLTWREFYHPLSNAEVLEDYTREEAQQLVLKGRQAASVFEEYEREMEEDAWIATELAHTSKMMALLGQKVLIVRDLQEAEAPDEKLAQRLDTFSDRLAGLYGEYEKLWLARNKPSELFKIGEKMNALIIEAQAEAARLRVGSE